MLTINHLTERKQSCHRYKKSSRITFQPTYANLLSSNITQHEFTKENLTITLSTEKCIETNNVFAIRAKNPFYFIAPLFVLCPPDKICAFPLPRETYQRYAHDALGTKPILSRGETGFHHVSCTGKKNGEMTTSFRLVCRTGSPVISFFIQSCGNISSSTSRKASGRLHGHLSYFNEHCLYHSLSNLQKKRFCPRSNKCLFPRQIMYF